ncbi:MAG: hypothetical protein ACI8Q1_003618 [Parvicella sp.]|jgi:hypothetical protein
MKYIYTLGLFTILLTLTYCDKQGSSNQDCDPSVDCWQQSIDTGYVHLDLTYKNGGDGVLVILYDGYVEDQDTLHVETFYQDKVTFELKVGNRYAAEAFYPVGGQTTIVLDGKKFKDDTYNDCGVTCYEFPEMTLNLKKL